MKMLIIRADGTHYTRDMTPEEAAQRPPAPPVKPPVPSLEQRIADLEARLAKAGIEKPR